MDWSSLFSGSPFGSMAPTGATPQTPLGSQIYDRSVRQWWRQPDTPRVGPFPSNLTEGQSAPDASPAMVPSGASGWQSNYMPGAVGAQPANQADTGAAATSLPGAPAMAPAPGILNGATPPAATAAAGPNSQNMGAAFDKLQAMVNPKMAPPPAMPQIQMARPAGAGANVDPMALIRAMMGGR